MTVALLTVLDELSPRTFGELAAEPAVEFDVIQEALFSAERCPATCGQCVKGTSDCAHTGKTV